MEGGKSRGKEEGERELIVFVECTGHNVYCFITEKEKTCRGDFTGICTEKIQVGESCDNKGALTKQRYEGHWCENGICAVPTTSSRNYNR